MGKNKVRGQLDQLMGGQERTMGRMLNGEGNKTSKNSLGDLPGVGRVTKAKLQQVTPKTKMGTGGRKKKSKFMKF